MSPSTPLRARRVNRPRHDRPHQSAPLLEFIRDSEGRIGYLPTPEQIAAACAEIRSGWSELDHKIRAGLLPAATTAAELAADALRWSPPIVRIAGKGVAHV